jgi:lipoyl(octanoyl) transferase
VKTDRGGQVTYHGPGQLIVYFLLDVRRRHYGVRTLVDIIETSILAVLNSYGIDGHVRKGAPGVYVEDKKIAALGLRIRRGCSLHGLSLNIDMDLSPFAYINPCGYPGLETTQLRDLISPTRMDLFGETQKRLIEDLQTRLL